MIYSARSSTSYSFSYVRRARLFVAPLVLAASLTLVSLTLASSHSIAAINPPASAAAVELINVAETNSLSQMDETLSGLLASAKATSASNSPNLKLQEALVTASGAAAGRISFLFQSSRQTSDLSAQAQTLLLKNRELLKHLLQHNEAVIRHYQEHELDKMADPVAFFESEQWQMPQQLISLASYWSGWNGYYASLLMDDEAPLRKTVLEESIEAFSRSFIDFAEDEITTKSLYGRGLVYKQLSVYGRAAYDFKSVKQKVGPKHELYLSSLYQEALISHETNNTKVAKAILVNIQRNYLQEEIPDFIRLGLKKLRAELIIGSRTAQKTTSTQVPASVNTASAPKKQETEPVTDTITKAGQQLTDAEIQTQFQKLRSVAQNDRELFQEFYRFTATNAKTLSSLSYSELTPIAALAIADTHFKARSFDAALTLYTQLLKNRPKIIQPNADGLWLSTGHAYNQQKKWSQVTTLLGGFSAQFPESQLLKPAAELYYSAGIAQHRAGKTTASHREYIAATQNYVKHCSSCALIDDARYELGRYYIKQQKNALAVAVFAKIGRESKHYFVSSFHVADAQVSVLESLQRSAEPGKPDEASKRYELARRILSQYQKDGIKDKRAVPLRRNWLLLQARFDLLSTPLTPKPKYSAVVASLRNFERTSTAKNTAFDSLNITAKSLRSIALLYLAKDDEFELAIGQMSKAATSVSRNGALQPGAKRQYDALQRLGHRLYSRPAATTSKQSVIMTEASRRGAIYVYQQLALISAQNKEYLQHLDSIQFRIASLYRQDNRAADALEIYLALVVKNPDSADARYALASTYIELEQWKNSLEIWRQLSKGLDAGSPSWFEARYQTAFLMGKLDRPKQACSIAKMTRVLHPKVAQSRFSERFNSIEGESCKSPSNE